MQIDEENSTSNFFFQKHSLFLEGPFPQVSKNKKLNLHTEFQKTTSLDTLLHEVPKSLTYHRQKDHVYYSIKPEKL